MIVISHFTTVTITVSHPISSPSTSLPQVRYIMNAIALMLRNAGRDGRVSLECRQDALDEYYKQLLKTYRNTVWLKVE